MTCFIWLVALKFLAEQWSSYSEAPQFTVDGVHLLITGPLLGLGPFRNSGHAAGDGSEASAPKCLKREMHVAYCGLLPAAALNRLSVPVAV